MTQRLLFVTHTGALGGAELMLLDLVSHYPGRSHVALLADGPLRGRLEAMGVPVTVLAADTGMLRVGRAGGRVRAVLAAPSVFAAASRLASLARHHDLLYPNSQKAALIGMIAGRLAGRPVVWHLHDILTEQHFGGLQRRVMVTLANLAARRVVANSEATRAAFIAAGGDAGRVLVAPNGIDPAPFDAIGEGEIQALRATIGGQAMPLIGMFGRLSPWKGQHVLIEALARLADAGLGVEVAIVGGALFGETEYEDRLRTQATALGVAGRVHWLGFRDDVPALMRAVDLVVHASTAPEPFGRVIVEAMLARRLVIASSDGAAAELLGTDYPYLVEPGDPAALAAALTRALGASAAERAPLIDANCDRARTRFSTKRMLAQVDTALEEAA